VIVLVVVAMELLLGGRMSKAIKKLVKSIYYLLSGRIEEREETLGKDPNVLRAKYKNVIARKEVQVANIKKAVATLACTIKQREKELVDILEQIDHRKTIIKGAEAEGEDTERSQYRLSWLEKREKDLHQNIAKGEKYVEKHKKLYRDMELELRSIMEERNQNMLDITMLNSQRSCQNTLSVFTDICPDTELKELRETIDQIKTEAEIDLEGFEC